jgi:hypothetical protein
LTAAPSRRTVLQYDKRWGKPEEVPMVKALMLPYAAVAGCFLRAYLPRLTMAGALASLVWPVSFAVALTWLVMLDDDPLSRL